MSQTLGELTLITPPQLMNKTVVGFNQVQAKMPLDNVTWQSRLKLPLSRNIKRICGQATRCSDSDSVLRVVAKHQKTISEIGEDRCSSFWGNFKTPGIGTLAIGVPDGYTLKSSVTKTAQDKVCAHKRKLSKLGDA